MRAIDREHLEAFFRDTTNPAGDSIRLAVPLTAHGVRELRQTGFSNRERIERAERYPGLVCIVRLYGREEVLHYGNCDSNSDYSVEQCTHFQ
jgi:hypothetical protein